MAHLAKGAGIGISLEDQLAAEALERETRKTDAKKFKDDLVKKEIPIAEQNFACADLRWQVKYCIMTSECVKERDNSPSECMKSGKIDQACYDLHHAYAGCLKKRLNPSYRIKGEQRGRLVNEKQDGMSF